MNHLLIFLPLIPIILSPAAYQLAMQSRRRGYAVLIGAAGAALLASFWLLRGAFLGQEISLQLPVWAGFGLSFRADGFRALYVTVLSLMWLLTGLLTPEYFIHGHSHSRYLLFTLITFGASLGVFLSDDFYTALLFFEVMSLASYPWVAHEEDNKAMRAAATYLAIAIFGGMSALLGLILLKARLGTLAFSALPQAMEALADKGSLLLPGIFVLIGFGAKAGIYPLHVWLPKAHPVAPAPASALLSGGLTKIGIFGILVLTSRVFIHDALWGRILLVLGAITMVLGAVLGLMSVNIKRTLACSSVSQIGFITIGAAMQALLGHENALAAQGTVLHMLNHSFIKLTLFMAVGVLVMKTHRLNLNAIKGYGRKKPFLAVVFLIGAASISGIPLFSGYISKTLLHESLLEYIHFAPALGWPLGIVPVVETLFTITGGLTFAYMLKLFIAVFVEKNGNDQVQAKYDSIKPAMNPVSGMSLALSALVLLFLGLFPGQLMTPLANLSLPFLGAAPPAHAVDYFAWVNLKGAAISLAIGLGVYLLVVRGLLMRRSSTGERRYVNRLPAWVDLENRIYRPLISLLASWGTLLARLLEDALELVLFRLVLRAYSFIAALFGGRAGKRARRRLNRLANDPVQSPREIIGETMHATQAQPAPAPDAEDEAAVIGHTSPDIPGPTRESRRQSNPVLTVMVIVLVALMVAGLNMLLSR
ncbi:MAG: complex I subunit 5 family protein [Eubacteriales bacterium]|nr:complex I subunit 5 family protein [Eubacteriales bacterium]